MGWAERSKREREREISQVEGLALPPQTLAHIQAWTPWESAKIAPVKQTPNPTLFYTRQLFIRKFADVLDNVV